MCATASPLPPLRDTWEATLKPQLPWTAEGPGSPSPPGPAITHQGGLSRTSLMARGTGVSFKIPPGPIFKSPSPPLRSVPFLGGVAGPPGRRVRTLHWNLTPQHLSPPLLPRGPAWLGLVPQLPTSSRGPRVSAHRWARWRQKGVRVNSVSFLQWTGSSFSFGTLGRIAMSEGNARARPQHPSEAGTRGPRSADAASGSGRGWR